MNLTEIKILETAISVLIFLLIRIITNQIIERTVKKKLLQKTRGKIIKKIFQVVIAVVTLIFILSVWGIDQSELFMFMTSVLAVIGIALFAQWSHLSNITSGMILFFNHSFKLDDTVVIMEKDYEVEGRISDIGLFFVKLITSENEEVLLPNNVFLQKMIKKKTSKV